MKIVHVLPSLARGGGERLMIELANREAAAGHEVTAVIGYPIPAAQAHAGLSAQVQVRYLRDRQDKGPVKYLHILPWLRRERSWLASQDVVHCHLTYGAIFGTALRAMLPRRRRPAIVETYHAVGMPIPQWQTWFNARMLARRDGLSFMADNAYWQNFVARHPRLTARVIPVGVDAPDVAAIDAAARGVYRAGVGIAPDATHIVGTIGRLSPDRQQHRYVTVFAAIAASMGPGVHFLMGGDGPERQRIADDIAAAGLEGRIHLPGLVRDLEPPLSIMDLYITSNVGSAPGVAGLQAIAAGVPVIALQLADGYKPQGTDWIWSSADEAEVAARAVELLQSEQQRRALGFSQKAYLDAHHSPEAMARAYQSLYRDAAGRLSPPAPHR